MQNVVSIQALRRLRTAENEDPLYHARIGRIDKLQLLEELVRFQEERTRLGSLTPELMVKGKALFSALETHAETNELQLLARSYRRHLDYEMEHFLKHGESE